MTITHAPLPRPVRRRRIAFTTLVWGVALLALLFLVGSPIASLIASSFRSTDTGAFTFENYGIAYSNARDLQALGNSLLYAVEVTILSALFAVPIAWGVSRTDMPGKGFIQVRTLGAFITPPYLGAIAWILLAGPNAAKLFMEFLAGPEYSRILAEGFEQPLRTDVPPPPGAKSLAEIKTFSPSVEQIEKQLPANKQKWRDTFSG